MKILEIELAKKLADTFNNQPKIAKQFETFFGILIFGGIQLINIGGDGFGEYKPLLLLTILLMVFIGMGIGLWKIVEGWFD